MTQSIIRQPMLVLASVLASLSFATAAQAESLQVKQWAASCAACHGTDGYSEGGMASLAGQNKAELIKKMNEYKTGKRTASIMHQLSKGYSDEQIEQISAYFASLPAEKAVAKTK
ncbi:cytochrome c [Polynucleobacter sp. 30F-ANTBAC]|jgi:cytochrome subunit of sulfide dehydrogenase|uniref:c-type cytochrome n=1 Tax=Polynucleobacter sp. 30F-ANTBAC TaxID=2689095 RepID=UPI0021039699|nr:cytochrome c [Polynucleobacter sp. 30F-ANTBAC]